MHGKEINDTGEACVRLYNEYRCAKQFDKENVQRFCGTDIFNTNTF